jgi:hypothetical protein
VSLTNAVRRDPHEAEERAGTWDLSVTEENRMLSYVFAVALSALALSSAHSADEQTLAGRRLLLKENADATKNRIVAVTGEGILVGNGGTHDPVLHGGGLRVLTSDGCGGPCDTTYPLPASGWSYVGPLGGNIGYKFSDSVGPIRKVVVRSPQRIRVVGKGSALGHDLAANPDPVDVVVTTGDRSYCARYGGTVSFVPDSKFLARKAPVSPGCPTAGSASGAFID